MNSNGSGNIKEKCGGPDSDRRIPTKTDLESVAFDQALQPPQFYRHILMRYLFSYDIPEILEVSQSGIPARKNRV